MNNATLEKIFRYPIKSMMGESLESAQITDKGLLGDRAWAVRDEERGGIRGGKKIPALMTLAATTAEPAPTGDQHRLSEPGPAVHGRGGGRPGWWGRGGGAGACAGAALTS